jgi:EAL domain-containing protein (putative c-di-GMP-specific phosphodiesterase class I)
MAVIFKTLVASASFEMTEQDDLDSSIGRCKSHAKRLTLLAICSSSPHQCIGKGMEHWVREFYSAGYTIFKEGDLGNIAYLIERGSIRISSYRTGKEQDLALLKEGDMFGEIALIDRRARTATATATEETTLIPISRDLVVNKLKQSDPLLSYILQVVVERWRESMGGVAQKSDAQYAEENDISNLKTFAIDQLKIAQSLSDAINRDEFLMYYQPVVHLHNRQLAGFEALIRWNQPDMGFISPVGFIGVAENTGLIVPMGRWVLKTSLAALAGFQAEMDAHHPNAIPLFMSINVSARQLQEHNEVEALIEIIKESGVNPKLIKLEITESALIGNPELAAEALKKLKALDLLIAIDDFGTGYSSLNYLSQFPIDTLKIDQSFVFSMLAHEGSRRITKAIASMAHDLEMNCIAEGIEQEADIPVLQQMRVEYGQGYFFAKPYAQDQVPGYIKNSGGGIAH